MQRVTAVKLFVGLSGNLIINKMNIQNQAHRTESLNYSINTNKMSVFLKILIRERIALISCPSE
jgi:hypothetical protein